MGNTTATDQYRFVCPGSGIAVNMTKAAKIVACGGKIEVQAHPFDDVRDVIFKVGIDGSSRDFAHLWGQPRVAWSSLGEVDYRIAAVAREVMNLAMTIARDADSDNHAYFASVPAWVKERLVNDGRDNDDIVLRRAAAMRYCNGDVPYLEAWEYVAGPRPE